MAEYRLCAVLEKKGGSCGIIVNFIMQLIIQLQNLIRHYEHSEVSFFPKRQY